MKLSHHLWLGIALMTPVSLAAKPVSKQASMALPRAQFVVEMDAEFRKLDGNKDAIVDRSEIEESQQRAAATAAKDRFNQVFKQLDKNKDGRLSPAEFGALAASEAKPTGNAEPMLARFDANRDGQIGLVEYRAATQANFDQIDADRDGVVSGQEMKAAGLNR